MCSLISHFLLSDEAVILEEVMRTRDTRKAKCIEVSALVGFCGSGDEQLLIVL
jgi:hypothetical protein